MGEPTYPTTMVEPTTDKGTYKGWSIERVNYNGMWIARCAGKPRLMADTRDTLRHHISVTNRWS